MAFLISQNNGGIVPGLEYLPAGAITPKIGMALVMTDGNLAACGATTRPQYICATAADEALDAGNGMQVTATTTSGVAEVVSMDGTAIGDTVYVRFPA